MPSSVKAAWKRADLSDLPTSDPGDGTPSIDNATNYISVGPRVALQEQLVSGTNIATLNGESLLSAENIVIPDVQSYAVTNPATADPNYAPAMEWSFASDGTTTNPNYSTHAGLSITYSSTSGKNFADLSAKTTFLPFFITHDAIAWGQKFLRGGTMNAWGNGDAIGEDMTFNVFGGLDAQGDEGVKFQRYVCRQGQNLNTTTITAVAKSTVNTTLSAAITKSKDSQTVNVGSTTGLSVGQWVIVGSGAPSTSGFNAIEAVKVTALTSTSITGVFAHDHSSGDAVRGATVLTINYAYQWGQGRWCVNLSGSSYTTGTARGIGTEASPSSTIEGSGTSWANNMVGGSSDIPGMISFAADNYTGTPYSNTGDTLRAWYPIASVSSGTALSIYRRDQVGLAGYEGNQTTLGSYTIRPGARILAIEGATVVLDYNTFTWTVGHTVECAHSTSLDVSGCTWDFEFYTPGQSLRNGVHVYNTGTQDFESGISVGPLGANGGGFTTGASIIGEKWGIAVQGGVTGVSNAAAMQITADSSRAGRIQWGTGLVGLEYDYTLDSLELNFGDGYGGTMISRRDGDGQRSLEYSGSLDLKQTSNTVKPFMGIEGFSSRHFYWEASDYASNGYLVFYAGLIGSEVPVWRYSSTTMEMIPSASATNGTNVASSQFVFVCNVWDGAASAEKRWTSGLDPVSNSANAKQAFRVKRPTSNSSYPATVLDVTTDGVLTIGTQNFSSGVEQDKACVFDPTGITSGQTRTMTIPDQSGSLVLSGSGSSDPTTSNVQSGTSMIWHNTTSGEVRIWRNVSGTMVKSAAFT